MTKKDIALILSLFVVFGTVLILRPAFLKNGTYVLITKENAETEKYSLYSEKHIVLEGNEIVIENGYVYMKAAICPDKLCVKSGKISKKGEQIICLPNRVIVRIE